MLLLPKNWRHIHLSATSSTMAEIRNEQYAPHQGETVLLTTDYQTAGRGQRGTSWEARPGENLLFSFRFRPENLLARQQFYLSEALALAVRAALSKYAEGFSVKWPNDVYFEEKKVCGMLLEHKLQGTMLAETITGVGININQKTFESDAPNPVSLFQITGKATDCDEVLSSLVQEFTERYLKVKDGRVEDVHAEYLHHLFRRKGFHRYRDAQGEFLAEIAAISPIGQLTLRREDGSEQTYSFKEVTTLL